MEEIEIDPIYEKDVILTAAYVMLEKAYFFLKKRDDRIVVEITPKDKDADIKKITGEFKDQLINYAQHLEMAKKSRDAKKMLLKEIFSAASCDDSQEIDDPEGILVPWEEKYGKKQL